MNDGDNTMRRRRVLEGALAAALPACPAWAAPAPFPTRTLSLTVAFAPGGAGDIVARRVTREMAGLLGQSVVVENRPVPLVGITSVARSRPDGHTMMMVGNGTALSSALFRKLPYDLMGDFAHVSAMAVFDLALVVDGRSSFGSVAEVLRFARSRPGQLNIGTVRVGSSQHLTASMFAAVAGIDAVIVPFKSTADIVSGLRNGDLHLAIETVPPLLAQINAGSLRPLAITTTRRSAVLPAVPTLAEAGVVGVDVTSWNGISVPAATPQAVVEQLASAVRQAVATPTVRRELLALGIETDAGGPQAMTRRLREDIARWAAVIDQLGIERQ